MSDANDVAELHVRALQACDAYTLSGQWDDDLRNINANYIDQGGEFLVGVVDERIVAIGAFRKVATDTIEIKRMRTEPALQGLGVGRLMLRTLERRAAALGFTRALLDTTVRQVAARRLYESEGYIEMKREVEGWPFETIFYEKRLPYS